MTLTEDIIQSVKNKGETAIHSLISQCSNSSGNLIFVLSNLGHLPKTLSPDVFLDLFNNKNRDVRFWSVKNLSKLENTNLINCFYKLAKDDTDTIVRREAISAIGRLRDRDSILVLKDFLDDEDPKVVCQAIRGLLCFKGNEVDELLKPLISHKNEMVRAIIHKEYYSKTKIIKQNPHPFVYPYLKNTVVNADVLKVLPLIPDDSIHLTFTSPPYYNARDYSIYPSYQDYLEFLGNVFKNVMRVTKEGRFLIVNTSPIIIPRISRSHSSKRYPIPFDLHAVLSAQGWEFIDDIVWEKPEYSVKNRIGGFQQHKKPLAYKPNTITEYLMVYRKPTDKLLDWNIKQYPEDIVERSKVKDGFETNNVWKICPKSDKVHSAIFPLELCKRVIQYYSFVGDLVFDPFAGSGTLGRAAKDLDRSFFLTEMDKNYFDYIKKLNCDSLLAEDKNRFFTLDDFRRFINETI